MKVIWQRVSYNEKSTGKGKKKKTTYDKSKTTTQDITNFVSKLTWSGASTQASRQVSISIANPVYDKNINVPKINVGDIIKVYSGNEKIPKFIGRVPNKQRTSDVGTIKILAYDYIHNMLQSTMTKKFNNKTPEYITKAILKDCGIKAGKIAKTKKQIKRFYPSEMSPYDIIVAAYGKVAKKTEKVYFFRMHGDEFEVVEKGEMVGTWLEEKVNLMSSKYETDTDKAVNKVVVWKNNKKVNEVKNEKSIKKLGIIQKSITVDKGKGKKEANNTLKGATKSASISVKGIWSCTAGKAVKIKDKISGLSGKYWIMNDTHTFENGIHTMNLDLEFKNKMETVNIQELEVKKKTKKHKNNDSTEKYEYKYTSYPATYTAYVPTGNRTANGEETIPARHTCASGRQLEFDTVFTVQGTGTDQDGIEYRVNDRPAADTIDGGIHIDLLMSTVEECNQFGVRHGELVIKQPIANADAAVNPVIDQLLEYAKSFMGSPYVWGGKDPHTGADCSGFVGYVYQHFGYPITQWTCAMENEGRLIDASERRKGDMILFQGTYDEPNCVSTHVGIMVDYDNYIEDNSTRGVTISPYNSQWCAQHFYQIRRVIE